MASDALNLTRLAHQAYSRGDIDAAMGHLQQGLALDPRRADTNFIMGLCLANRGDRVGAIHHLQRSLSVDDDFYEAHIAMSTVLFASGNSDGGIFHGERALALQPSDPATLHHLSRNLIAHGRTEAAIPYLQQALKVDPSHPALLQDLATALTEVGQLGDALKQWRRLTKLHPDMILGWLKVGGIAIAGSKFKEAIEAGKRAVTLEPNSAEARVLLGLALLGEDHPEEAEVQFAEAVRLKPDDRVTQSAYGLALHEMGRFEEARPYFERTLELVPTSGQAYYSLLRTKKTTEAERPLLDKLERYVDDPAAEVIDRSYMHFALAKANEDLKNYEIAMRNFDAANELATEAWYGGKRPDLTAYCETITATIETFTPEYLSRPGRAVLESAKPLLVVGMIRSGTTLVEQILSSHPEIKGAGELTYWHDEVANVFNPSARTIDEDGLLRLAKGYLNLMDHLGGDAARVTDKLPHNYTMLGFILSVIPNARVVYVKRNPVDNCLSIYTTAFQKPPSYALSRENIVTGYREQERILAHWKKVLPGHQLLEVNYEDLISNREAETRRMIEFTGLPWDDACLHHEKNVRTVSTPSYWQVRQPIYKTSVERWRNFEPWLGEFRSLLAPADLAS